MRRVDCKAAAAATGNGALLRGQVVDGDDAVAVGVRRRTPLDRLRPSAVFTALPSAVHLLRGVLSLRQERRAAGHHQVA